MLNSNNIDKKLIYTSLVFAVFWFSYSCEKEKTGNGRVTFYVTEDFSCGDISVEVEGHGTQMITGYFVVDQSDCGADGAANFALPPGNYTYNAHCQGKIWGPASINVPAGECVPFKLK